jgi:hypothetical protein
MDLARPEQAPGLRTLAEKYPLNEGPEGPAKPLLERDKESHLSVFEDRLRQEPLSRAARNALKHESLELQPTWYRGGKLCNPMIKQRHSIFQGVSHRHSVLNEEERGQISLDIKVQDRIQGIRVL